MSVPDLTIVVEGLSDAEAIRAMLGKEKASRTRFFAGHGKISLASLARNVVVHEGGPVLTVIDADTTSERLIGEQVADLRSAIASAISYEDASRFVGVFAFVPELEVIFFEAPAVLERLLGVAVSPTLVRDGLLAPKRTLASLLERIGRAVDMEFIARMREPGIAEALAQGRQAAALLELARTMRVMGAPSEAWTAAGA